MIRSNSISVYIKTVGKLRTPLAFLGIVLSMTFLNQVNAQSIDSITTKELTFESEGIHLAGTVYQPKDSYAGLVIVHGSDQVPRMTEFAELLAQNGISVLTYDKRGVGASEGVYAGPEVGTNNIDSANLTLLAHDASAAVNKLHELNKNIPIGLIGFSQAGWIIPISASNNLLVEFMVLFSCPTITTLEQLRFQFYTDGNKDFWENHTEEEAREHVKNDPDRYQFVGTDPKESLEALTIPGLWIFGGRDIQIPVGLCIEDLNGFKAEGKLFDYALFSKLGHNTAFANSKEPVDISIHWIKQKAVSIK